MMGQGCTIDQLEAHEAHHTLGVQLSPDGNCCEELQYLQSIASDWTIKMEGVITT